MGVAAKHSSMVFYSDGADHYSQRIRLVLAEKGVTVDVVDVDPNDMPEDFPVLNPYNSLPTLIDREVVLYESKVTMEYLDERFPHPPLLPVYPVARAEARLCMYRIQRDWCGDVDKLLDGKEKPAQLNKARKALRDSLISASPVFAAKPFFMNDEFTLMDCCVAPILWRLPVMGVELPKRQTAGIYDYMNRMFDRDSFRASLSEAERDMRDD